MAGFFSGLGGAAKGLFGNFGNAVPQMLAANAAFQGDYDDMAKYMMYGQRLQGERSKEAQKAQALERVRAGLKARGYQDSDIDVIMANPDNASALIMEALKTRSGGAEGLTVATPDPVTGQLRTQTTAGWHDGSYFGGTGGTKAPERLYQGEKVFPVTKGGYLGVYGGPQAPTEAQQPPSGPQPAVAPKRTFMRGQTVNGYKLIGDDDTDPNNWVPIGGAGREGPPTFPRPH